jgi:hypothetical protein
MMITMNSIAMITMNSIANMADAILEVIAMMDVAIVPSSDKLDDDYSIQDILNDLTVLYPLRDEVIGLANLLEAARQKTFQQRKAINDRCVELERMLRRRLGAI